MHAESHAHLIEIPRVCANAIEMQWDQCSNHDNIPLCVAVVCCCNPIQAIHAVVCVEIGRVAHGVEERLEKRIDRLVTPVFGEDV